MTKYPPPSPQVPEGLTRWAGYFLRVHGHRVPCLEIEQYRDDWRGCGVPREVIDRAAAYQQVWGGIALPPSLLYCGGPKSLDANVPELTDESWWFEAGGTRVALPYEFVIGPGGEFGIYNARGVILHASIEGWVEAQALTHYATCYAKRITQVQGDEVDALDLDRFEPLPQVRGIADTWWRGTDSLIAVYRGDAECFEEPTGGIAYIYEGFSEASLDSWAPRGG
ncbi:hypothetical protein [Streptomyces sp. NPDC002851]